MTVPVELVPVMLDLLVILLVGAMLVAFGAVAGILVLLRFAGGVA